MPDLRITTTADGLAAPFAPAALLVDKPGGMSSFGVVKKVRWATRQKKVGHAGTLDPMATGLLILLLGRDATRQQDRFMGLPKVYSGTVRLGQTTASYDADSEIELTRDAGGITDDALDAVRARFTGVVTQTPPIYSAIKVGGERLYKKARRGETTDTVEIKSRQVEVSEFVWTDRRGDDVDFRIGCSKGTYIRSIAHDVGQALGVGAHLVALRRDAIGPFRVDEAFPLSAFERDALGTEDAPPA